MERAKERETDEGEGGERERGYSCRGSVRLTRRGRTVWFEIGRGRCF